MGWRRAACALRPRAGALAKLDDGTYGLCDACGEPIAPKRLRAMPDSVLCVACAATEPRARPLRR